MTWLLPVRNGMPYLTEALASVEAQTYRNWCVLAWDNGSVDESVEELRHWIPGRIPGTVVAGQPLGLGDSLANMVNLAQTEFCARIDADDVNAPDRLERQVPFLQSNPDVAAVGGQMLQIDGHGQVVGPFGKMPLTDDEIVSDMLDGPGMGHPTVLFRRSAVLAAGNYRDVGSVNVEDYDLWLRLAVSHRLANLDVPVLRYRVHEGGSTVIAERAGVLHGATMQRFAELAPALYGCTASESIRLSSGELLFALPVLVRMATHLRRRSGMSPWRRLRSGIFVRAARKRLAPGDLVSLFVLWLLEKRPGCFLQRTIQSIGGRLRHLNRVRLL